MASRRLVAEPVVITGILLSTLAMFMLGFTVNGSVAYWVWLGIDVMCVAYFVIEAMTKIQLDGWDGYWSQRWNRFDFVILVLSLPVLAAPVAHETIAFVGVPVLRL